MARIRTIKPEFFKHEGLADLSFAHRLLFIGLWTLADREGRLFDRPKRIKVELLPYDVTTDVDALLADLCAAGFIERYVSAGVACISVPSFLEHQRITGAELQQPSKVPENNEDAHATHIGSTRDTLATHSGHTQDDRKGREGKGKEGNGVEEGKGHTEGVRATVLTDATWGPSPARKRKAHCAFESTIGVDVPEFLHGEFVAKLTNAGQGSSAHATLQAWYAEVERSYAASGAVIGEDAPDFWRVRFRERHGRTDRTPKPTAADDYFATRDYTPTKFRKPAVEVAS